MTNKHVETLEELRTYYMRFDAQGARVRIQALDAAIALMRGQNGLLARQDAGGLPELPERQVEVSVREPLRGFPGWAEAEGDYYTADQMRAYGELCRAAPAGGERCDSCDGTGLLHRADGMYVGECHCVHSAPAWSGEVADWMVRVALDASRATEVKMGSLSKAPDEQRMRNALAALLRKLQQGAE